MLALKKFTFLARTIQRPNSFGLSDDKWKDRDQAAEKVYVSQQESTFIWYVGQTLKKLLQKAQ